VRLADLLRYNLRTVRSYLLKEDFQFFWGYRSPYWAGCFLDRWPRNMRATRFIGPIFDRIVRVHHQDFKPFQQGHAVRLYLCGNSGFAEKVIPPSI
jgi:hypothetical protein